MKPNNRLKKLVLVSICSMVVSLSYGQEWFTSFDVASRLARVQDKMLFVLWEDTFLYPIPVKIDLNNGKRMFVDLSKDTRLDSLIWKYFIPVKISESEYATFLKKAEGKGYRYMNKLNDDSIKIMDVNGHILNIRESSDYDNFSQLVNKYALNTSYVRSELDTYSEERNFLTSSLLGLRYIDYAIFLQDDLKSEVIGLANIYLDESKTFVKDIDKDKQDSYLQKLKLVRIKELLILNKFKRAYRQLRKIDATEVDAMNERLYAFLNYTIFRLMEDETNTDLWKSKISLLDLKKAELIIKGNLNGSAD